MEVNEAVELAHRQGILSAASLMVAGPAAAHAVKLAKRMPDLRVGLHLVLVEGQPLLPRQVIRRLLASDGRFHPIGKAAFAHALSAAARQQYREEIEAQFAAFHQSGLELDHVNAHQHFHVHPGVAGQILSVGAEGGMRAIRLPIEPAGPVAAVEPVRASPALIVMQPWAAALRRRAIRAGLRIPDAVFGLRWTGRMTASRLAGLLDHLPEGLNEIYLHPATADTFDGAAKGYRYRDELAALTDPEVVVRARSFACGGYCR